MKIKKSFMTIVAIAMLALAVTACSGSKAPTKIEVTSQAQILGEIGESCDLSAQLVFEENVDTTVTYTSSDEAIAVVSEEGVVTAGGYGVATITITSAADESVSTTVDVAVVDYNGAYSGEKYIGAMGCDIAIDLTIAKDGTFEYYRAPMLIVIEGGGQMPELSDKGTYTINGTKITFTAEMLGEYSADLSISDGKCLLNGKFPTGGASTEMELIQK